MAARKRKEGTTAYTLNREIFIPEHEIKKDSSSYIYVPLRGYSAMLAVYDINDRVIGWIDTRTLGYENVGAWIKGEKWIDGGY